MLRNLPLCPFPSFSIILLTLFINKPDSSRDLTVLNNVVTPDPKMFLCIPAATVNYAAVNPNGIKTLLVNDLSIFFIKGKPVFSNGP